MNILEKLEKHSHLCREALEEGRSCPEWTGGSLEGTSLAGADLKWTNLAGANLKRAYLWGADLGAADLRRADLRRATLVKANLKGANLKGANLKEAELVGACLEGVDLMSADLQGSYLGGADLRGAKLPDDVPFVPNLPTRILEAIEQGGILDMKEWHTCETTHSLGGWAIHLAGKEGYALVEKMGSSASGALIFARSGCHPIPDFFGSNEGALGALRRHVGSESTPAEILRGKASDPNVT